MLGASMCYSTTCAHLIPSKIIFFTVTMKKDRNSRIQKYFVGGWKEGSESKASSYMCISSANEDSSLLPVDAPGLWAKIGLLYPGTWLGWTTMQSHSIIHVLSKKNMSATAYFIHIYVYIYIISHTHAHTHTYILYMYAYALVKNMV